MTTVPTRGKAEDIWKELKRHTPARIGLARAGAALATTEQLAFQLAHARARDAVHTAFLADTLVEGLRARGFAPLRLRSLARDRATYLTRPDLGRRLDAPSTAALGGIGSDPCDLALVIADGLSAAAVHRHALPVVDALKDFLQSWRVRTAVVEGARVAIGDEIGEGLRAALVAVLIGERPGLSSPDSLGIYVTWAPKPGCTDALRNCISNVRPEGLAYADAAARLAYLLTEARRRGVSGVLLKDETARSDVGAIAR